MIEIIKDLYHQPFFLCFLAILTCACFYLLKKEKSSKANIVWIVYALITGASFSVFIVNAIYKIYHPQVWDFSCFYLYGKVAAGGHNYYLPENYHQIYDSLHYPASFYKELEHEVLDVGFPYPPPTIFYFVPLGFLSFHMAIIVWTIFILLFAFGSIYLLYSLFLKSYKLNGLLLVSSLFFIFLPSISNLSASQTNFILLFYLLLIKKYSGKGVSGIFLALAMFTKPYMAILFLFFLLTKKWKAVIYFILSAAIICAFTFIIFGKEPFLSYIFDNPSQRLPVKVFSEDVNQSLHAVLLRSNLITVGKSSGYIYIVAAILLFAGMHLILLAKRKLHDYILPVLLLVGLLIYPGTLSYYGVPLLFILIQFFDEKSQLRFNTYLNVLLIGLVYAVSSFSLFLCICFLLVILIIKSLTQPALTVSV